MNASSKFFGVYSTLIGSLPKPPELVALQYARIEGQAVEAGQLVDLTLRTMTRVVRMQIERGIDVIVSGEADRAGFLLDIIFDESVTGFSDRRPSRPWFPADLADHPDLAHSIYTPAMGRASAARLACTGPITLRDPEAIHRELTLFKQVLAEQSVPPERAVWTEPSPGTIAASLDNFYYDNYREYVTAIAAVMRKRYRAVFESGLLLQVDCPDLLMDRHIAWQQLPLEQFLEIANLNVEVLNEALEGEGIPLESVRGHSCYGNYVGTDTRDEPLERLLAPLLRLQVNTLLLEGAVSRHRWDYRVVKTALDAGSVPPHLRFGFGVIDTKHPSVETPESIALQLIAMRAALGDRLVAAHPDCGLETMSGLHNFPESVAWEKIAQLAPAVQLTNQNIEGEGGAYTP